MALTAAAAVLSDLAKVGWHIEISHPRGGEVAIRGRRPVVDEERDSRRRQLLAARGDALRDESTRQFVASMEVDRRWGAKTVSIFSLMLDGRTLAARLEDGRPIKELVRPYVTIIDDETTCPYTGLRLADVWRYFRLTWTNAPRSIPARQMRFVVRDAAYDCHPILGIGEVSGAAIRVGARDRYIGWDESAFSAWWRDERPADLVSWVHRTIEAARAELYIEDFRGSGVLTGTWRTDTSCEVIQRLRAIAVSAREDHEDAQVRKSHPDPELMTAAEWEAAAVSPLFRSKRAGRLADLLELWIALEPLRAHTTAAEIEQFFASSPGRRAVTRILRIAKARLQGIAIADLTVCGAVAPYNLLLGGKLVAMMAASPEIATSYRQRYSGRPSIIASSMAGRPIAREATLVLLSTTGLYGVRPSQYDRLSLPASVCGGDPAHRLRWHYVQPKDDSAHEGDARVHDGKTAGWGTFHFSAQTVRALESWLIASTRRRRVSYQYGEGASPRLRLLREGLGSLGLDPKELLVHGLAKTLYVCSLIHSPHRYLLGLDSTPQFVIPPTEDAESCTARIAAWWQDRWMSRRLERPELVEQLRQHTLIRPVEHGARVQLPQVDREQISLFGTW